MTIKTTTILLIISFFSLYLYGQKIPKNKNRIDEFGSRQGTWTILLDRNFKEIKSKKPHEYYRIINYKDDKPTGITKDYYKTGQVYWEGRLLKDRPNLIMDGEIKYYDKNGILINIKTFNTGFMQKQTVINEDGTRREVIGSSLSWKQLNTSGLAAHNNGNYSKAAKYFEEALKTLENQSGNKSGGYGQLLSNLAMSYTSLGLYDKANPLFVESLKIKRETFGENDPRYARAIENVGRIYFQKGQLGTAKYYMTASLAIFNKTLGMKNKNSAYILMDLGIICSALGDYTEAKKYLIESKSIIEEVIGKLDREYADVLMPLGGVYEKLEQYDSAYLYYNKAALNRLIVLGENHPDYIAAEFRIAEMLDGVGLYTRAEKHYKKVNNSTIEFRYQNMTNLSEQEKLTYIYKTQVNFQKFNSYVLRYAPEKPAIIGENYNNALATKGLLFQSQQKMKQTIDKSEDAELKSLYDNWLTKRSQIMEYYQLTTKERETKSIDLISEENNLNDLEKELSFRSSYFGKKEVQITWKDVREKLKPGEAAIELVRFKYHDKGWYNNIILYVAMIVTTESLDNPEMVILDNGVDLESKYLKQYRNSLKYKLEDKTSYNQYWQRIQNKLQGINKVYLSAEGIFHSISLEGLLNPETGKYLIDEIDINHVFSTKDILNSTKKRAKSGNVQLLGYPLYNQTKEDTIITNSLEEGDRIFNGKDIPMLPGTKVEITQIGRILNQAGLNVQTFELEDATEKAVKSWDNPLIVHLATHGYFYKDKDIEDKSESSGGIQNNVLEKNPLLRSGLLLANAQFALNNGGDGVLTAYEAVSLQLDETELVVLSACETGLGEVVNGEGVFGLQRAFQEAGTASVIMSLWQVDDFATQLLFTKFYQNWLIKGEEKKIAFKNAQLHTRQKYGYPYYWSAFVLVGN